MSKHRRDLVENEDYKPKIEWLLLVIVALLMLAIGGTLYLIKN